MDYIMDSDDDSDKDDLSDIHKADRNIKSSFHSGFISEMADDDEGIQEGENPHESAEKEILWASENGNVDIVKRLLAIDRNLTSSTDKDGYTPLHRAAYNNHLEILKLLLEHGADYNAETNDGWTPLHSACHWNAARCADKLMSFCVDLNKQSKGGITPLHLAASNSQGLETLQILLLHPKVDTSIRNNSNETAYELAIRKGRFSRFFEVTEPCFNYI